MRRRWPLLAGPVALIALLAAFFAGGHHVPKGKPHVVATIFPVYDLARRIAGADADVALLVPLGTNPEGYSPTEEIEARVTGARLAVIVGFDLDLWLPLMMSRVSPAARILRLADRVPTLPRPEGPTGSVDVHVWLDPQRAILLARAITDDLCRVDPDHAAGYRTRGVAVKKSLEELDQELERRTAAWAGRSFVTPRDDFRYYAERYHLGTARTATAKAAHAPEVLLDSIGGTAGVDSYEAVLRWDTAALEEVLSVPQ